MRRFLLNLMFISGIASALYSQTCIDASEVRTPWTNIPYFDGDNARIVVNEYNSNSSLNVIPWFYGDFSIDFWIKPTWLNSEAHDDVYCFFSAGHWDHDQHCLFAYFEEYSTNTWRIRLSDGDDAGSNADLLYNLNYTADWQGKWNHIAITYDNAYIRLYINGVFVKESVYAFNQMTDWHCTIGHNDDTGSDFRGYISGFRIWADKKLSETEVSAIKNLTFDGEESMPENLKSLHQYLKINMFTATDNVYSLVPNKSMVETGITRSAEEFHPAGPIRAYNYTTTEDYNSIRIDWESNSSYHTHYIYRKIQGQSGDGTLLCRTNDNYFLDEDPALTGDVIYQYTIKSFWRNPNNPLLVNSGWYSNPYPETIIASLKSYGNVQNLRVDQDASTGNCSGLVKLLWDGIIPAPPSYTVYYSIENGPWQELVTGLATTQYNHNVDAGSLGKQIRYKVDADGDRYDDFSNVVTGIGNSACSTAPTNLVSIVEDGNIKLTWDYAQSGAPASAFKIYRKANSGSFELLVQNISISSRDYIDLNAVMCTNYIYKVEAYNTCGGSSSPESGVSVIPVEFDNVFSYPPYTGAMYNVSDFDGSKGYYNTKVALTWSVNPNKKSDIDSYEIYRRKNAESYSLLTTINNRNATSFEDQNTEANTMYEYLIRAIGDCSGLTVISDSLTCVGFRYSTGIVAGKVTYSGGNAVPNVEVRVATEEQVSSTSLYFSGTGQYSISEEFLDDSLFYHPISTDTWIRPDQMNSGDKNVFFSIALGTFYVGLKHMKPVMGIYDRCNYCTDQNLILSLEADTVLNAEQWYHIATNYNPNDGTASLYLDGELVASGTVTTPQIPWWQPQTGCFQDYDDMFVLMGRADFMDHYLYSGHIDEMRIWQRNRSAEEIKRDYTRIITGTEDNIIAYYRFDENFGHAAYDLSKAEEFNKNDFTISATDTAYFPQWSNETPSFEQLHPSGITDANGNYTIRGVRYSSNGNIFAVTPFLGVHEFNPTDVNLFVGDASPVHNNINFVDQSSFRFTGTVYYEGTNMPVEGAEVYIDAVQQFDAGGNPVVTNQYGQIDISVPIGNHYVAVRKNGHTFLNNGQWPAPTGGLLYPKHNFQDNVYNITFTDQTKVVLTGRFVGGDVEGDKTPGLGLSIANIGQGHIVFKNEQGYDIDTDPDNYTDRISIFTNSETGEYTIEMLPVVYKVDSVFNDYYEIDNMELGLLDLSEIPDAVTVTDTTEDNTVNSFTYHFLRNFIYYSEPTITVLSDEGTELYGEPEYYVINPDTEETDTLDLLNNSPFAYPVFVMGKTYGIDISVNSIYWNYDGEEPVFSNVPVADATVTIVNNLEINEPVNSYTTNEDGKVSDYVRFRVGLPNMSMDEANGTSFTKTMTITAQTGMFNVAWNDGDPFRAYVLGGVDAGGVNYVTYGPEITKFILRDPPGDRSYTSLEEGSSYTVSRDYDFGIGGTSIYDNVIMRGVKFEVGGGLAGPVFTSEVQSDINIGISTTSWVNTSGEFMETYSFNQTYSTSSDPNGVGSMADVYIGKSTNLFFTETTNLRIYPRTYCDTSGLDYLGDTELVNTTSEFTIGKRPGFAVTDDPSSTMFVYSQDHILNTLLPTYRDMIYVLLATPKYQSNLPANHICYGMANNSPIFADSVQLGDHPSYTFLGEQGEVDSVAFLNQQIAIWLQTIAMNEASKLTGHFTEVENVSFDGNAGAYINELSTTESEYSRKNYFYRFEIFGGAETGFSINQTGMVTYSQTYKDVDINIGSSDLMEQSMKWKYYLDDSNQGDYYSVEVKRHSTGDMNSGIESFLNSNNYGAMSALGWGSGGSAVGAFIGGQILTKLVNPLAGQAVGMTNAILTSAAYLGVMGTYADRISDETVYCGLTGASPIFTIMGGQSRCPYEGEESTLFYVDSTSMSPYLLHPGTQNHEAPKVSIYPGTVINVPDGSPAVFTLSLTNESPTDRDLTYELQVDEAANPDGAILRIDGISPNRPFFIPAGQTVTKTLTVERGPGSVMDYVNLQLILHSSCQFNPDDNFPDIADTVSFSAHFVPVCTEVDFTNISDGWVVNSYNNNQLALTVSEYDVNLPTFTRVYARYQQAGATPTTFMTLFNDTTGFAAYTGEKMLINDQASVSFILNTSSLNDGEYTLFLTSLCSDESIYETEHYQGVIDRITPGPFGYPQPSDGILSYGENIGVRFNETINAGQLYTMGQYGEYSFIKLTGLTNGTDLTDNPTLLHDASIHFDGENDYMKIDNINLDQTDFTIEFWIKCDAIGRQCVLSSGNPSQGGLWLGFDEADHLILQIDGQTMSSDDTYSNTDEWFFCALAYNRGDETEQADMTMFVLNGASGVPQSQDISIYSSLEGSVYVGYCPEDGSALNGNIHELRIWNYTRLSTDIAAEKSILLNGYEYGLYGYWPMTELNQNMAEDLAFGRNAFVNATVHVSRNGKSVGISEENIVRVPTGSMAFEKQSDFTVEFWFKTPVPSSTATIMSNGYFYQDNNINAWNISVNSASQLIVENGTNTMTINASQYVDNNWHHFALSVNRLGYINVYLDGNLVKTATSSPYNGFGASHLVFGSRWYNLSMADHYDNYFNGYLDEIRIWNSARNQKHIKQYMHHTLNGNEPGLKAYFPFEDVTIPDPSINNQTALNFTTDTIGVAGNADFASSIFSDETPQLKLQRPEVLIPHTLSINNDEIVITPNIEAALIENQILNISVRKVRDMNNNEMSSTLNWTAFVDANQVVWEVQNLNIEKLIGDEETLSVNIRNKSGVNESFEITNIPSWMQVSPQSGSLQPLESKEIEITILPELNIGVYDRDLNLVSSMGYNERLSLHIAVSGIEPEWTVNPDDFQYSASLIGQLKINDIISTDENDIVAAFVNGECRGVANVQYFQTGDMYLLFMDVYSNLSHGEQIKFKIYDASTGEVYVEVSPELIFTSNSVYGSVANPVAIEAISAVQQTIALSQGWNWISFNVFSDNFDDLNIVLNDVQGSKGSVIKSQQQIAQYLYNGQWKGSLSGVNNREMYKLKVGAAQSFDITGLRVVSDTIAIPILAGWNWIGYPASTQTTLNQALSSIVPAENDIIKSQQRFAVYYPQLGWVGSLTYLEPNKGYMLYASNNGTLNINSGNSKSSYTEPMYVPQTALSASNMTIIAEIALANPSQYIVKAYSGNVLCGYSQALCVGDKCLFFLTINSETAQNIRFVAEDRNGGLEAEQTLVFAENEMLGNFDNPFLLSFKKIETNAKINDCKVYPNPFRENPELIIDLDSESCVYVQIIGNLGKVVAETQTQNLTAGEHTVSLENEFLNLAPGVYTVSVRTSNQEFKIKVVKN